MARERRYFRPPRHRINKMLNVGEAVIEPPLAVVFIDGPRRRALALPFAAGVRAPPVERRDDAVDGVARRDDDALVLRQRLPVDLVEVHLVVVHAVLPQLGGDGPAAGLAHVHEQDVAGRRRGGAEQDRGDPRHVRFGQRCRPLRASRYRGSMRSAVDGAAQWWCSVQMELPA